MDKEYMLALVKYRLSVLQARYKKACVCKDEKGNVITAGAAAAIRTQSKRDIQLLKLIEWLLSFSRDFTIEDEEAIDGFHRLVQPTERFRRTK